MKKTQILSTLAVLAAAGAMADPNDPYCPDTGSNQYVSAGGVVSAITVNTNPATGESVVLPVGVLMFDQATNSSSWNQTFNFGPKVAVLPRLNIKVSKGYCYNGPNPAPAGYPRTYSANFPVVVEYSTNLCNWQGLLWLVLYGSSTEVIPCMGYDYYYGKITGCLWSPSTTNAPALPLMQRSGTNGVCSRGMDQETQVQLSSGSVVTLWFNGPQTNGGCASDADLTGNWVDYPPTSLSATNYRLRYAGSTNCQTAQ